MAVVCPEVGSLNWEVFHVHIYARLLEDVTDVSQYDVDCLQPKTRKKQHVFSAAPHVV